MSPSSSQNDQALIRDELVAYLDGELAPPDCDRIEKRLAEDEAYLQELQGLDAAWSALDELQSATVDQSFTRTTIAMVAAQAKQDVTQQTAMLPRVRRRRKGLIALACCGAIVAGFIATRLLGRDSNILLIADLPVIELVDVYSQVPDVEFLLALDSEFEPQQIADLQPTDSLDIASLHVRESESPIARRHRIVGMSTEDRTTLLAKQNKFVAQSTEAQRQQMRDLHSAIQIAENKAKLQTLLLAYREWLSKRNPGELAELRQQPTAERLKLIRKFSQGDQHTLSDTEHAALRKEVLAFLEENREKIAQWVHQRRGDRAVRFLQKRPNALAPFVASMVLRSPRREELLQRLTGVLEEETQQRLGKVRNERAAQQMTVWIRQAFPNEVTPADLENYFVEELSNNDREKLLALPWNKMEAELTRRFQGERMGGPPGTTPWDSFRGHRPDRSHGQRRHPPFGGPDGQFRHGPPHGSPNDGPPEGPPPHRRKRRPPPGFSDDAPRPKSI